MKSFPQSKNEDSQNISVPNLRKPVLKNGRCQKLSSPHPNTDNQQNPIKQQLKKPQKSSLTKPQLNIPRETSKDMVGNSDSPKIQPTFSPLKPKEVKQTFKKPVSPFTLSKEPYLVDNNQNSSKRDKGDKQEDERIIQSRTKEPPTGPVKQDSLTNPSQTQDLMTVTDFYCTYHELIKEIIDKVLTMKFGSKVAKGTEDADTRYQIENEASEDVRNYLESKSITGLDYSKMPEYVHIIFAEAMGYGILEFLLNDKDVDEIMVQTHNNIYAEKHGVPVLTEYKFPSFDVAKGIVNRIIRPLNKTLDVSNPNVDAQLPDGSRLSASIPPLRAEGEISIDIRKFSDKVYPLAHYSEKYKSSTLEMVQFAEACVKAKKTTIVSGGTGSGKTTILNALTYALGENERILVIEDTREIRCQVPHTEYYLRVPGNKEGYDGISISDIIQMSLRKRPDRIFVGECRGGEFNEYLNAANTGHDGSMTSIHANSPSELFPRMENMLYKNDETKNMTHEAIMRVLASSVDIIIQTKRLEDGSRRITNITEVLGYGKEGFDKLKKMHLVKDTDTFDPYKIYMRDIFYFREVDVETTEENGFKKKHVKGQFVCTGYIPFCNKALKKAGVGFNNSFFEKRVLMEV